MIKVFFMCVYILTGFGVSSVLVGEKDTTRAILTAALWPLPVAMIVVKEHKADNP